jgi:hypothetical protein
MLFANVPGNPFLQKVFWISVLLTVVIHYAKKLRKPNPAVKDAAKKVAASKAIE